MKKILLMLSLCLGFIVPNISYSQEIPPDEPPVEDPSKDCTATVDFESRVLHIPCVVDITGQEEIDEDEPLTLEVDGDDLPTPPKPTVYEVFMGQRGNSMNWEVEFINEKTDDSQPLDANYQETLDELDGEDEGDDDEKENNNGQGSDRSSAKGNNGKNNK